MPDKKNSVMIKELNTETLTWDANILDRHLSSLEDLRKGQGTQFFDVDKDNPNWIVPNQYVYFREDVLTMQFHFGKSGDENYWNVFVNTFTDITGDENIQPCYCKLVPEDIERIRQVIRDEFAKLPKEFVDRNKAFFKLMHQMRNPVGCSRQYMIETLESLYSTQFKLRKLLHEELDKALDKMFELCGDNLGDVDMRIRNDWDVELNGEWEEAIYTMTYVEVLPDDKGNWDVEDRNVGSHNQHAVEF